MTDQNAPRRRRWGTTAIVLLLVLVVAAVATTALLTAGSSSSAPTATGTAGTTSSATPTASAASSATVPTPSVSPLKRSTPTPGVTASSPQPTRTAALAAPAPIKKALTAAVSRMEAVQGTASGPGEVAGPAVRFTITITNTTGKRVDLTNTVVNAYSGTDSAPAIELQSPGAEPFPASVANGASAKGVFVFNIPKADRKHVEITVDTSVLNPVVAFKGSAPR
jgi:hypothetical protein